MPKRHNQKGRSTIKERYVSLPYYMLRTDAWHSLSPVARSVYIELATIYNGGNNGWLALSARDAAKRVGCSKNTAARAFIDLEQKGFIRCMQQGHFNRKSRHAAEYRLTIYDCHRTGERASKAFTNWHPPDKEKFISGVTGDTDGVTAGSVLLSAKENYRSRSLS
ncbi:helix-turn-helix domain-containing protein [Microvirga puerhi]|uniref:Helix-turn-helix domain-containing protein n=1 Tax=Microvirga puerhi TaxID=2876078 RepID=A0ABS7VWA2_9HYPH|nr:helix-turn-helix domain-containing protein [Microvirga puerhi]MBZ6079182.1 helix-turn-helix domain-containing protein [Microvirga puerhi]